jgi:AcrR family transcriptional regulator
MTSFKRARSEEQRAERRRAILDTAAAMLAEMSVAQLSLNELSRRVGLAKSNVLHYFESREAVLLELLDTSARQWLTRVTDELAAEVDPRMTAAERGDRLVAVVATSLEAEPVLCDLVSAQAAVLEHNVSPEVAARYKHAAAGLVGAFATLVLRHLPELGEADAQRLGAALIVVLGAVWNYAQPSAAMLAAYATDPSLAAMRMDFCVSLRQMLEVFVSGLFARQQR